MRIAEIAHRAGLTIKSVRHYEAIGLIPSPAREANGYRDYDDSQLAPLRLIRRARTAGFNLEECRTLLNFLDDPNRHSHDVHDSVIRKVAAIDAQIIQLSLIRSVLVKLANSCANDDTPNCAILRRLSSENIEANE